MRFGSGSRVGELAMSLSGKISLFFFFIVGKCNLSVFAVRLGDEMGLELQFIKCREDLLLVGT